MKYTTISNLVKRHYWILQAIVIVVLFVFLKRERQKNQDFKEIYRLKQREAAIWKDDATKNRIRAEMAEINAANARLGLEEDLIRTLKREVGNLQKNLISYSSVKASTYGTFKTSVVDTVYVIGKSETLPVKKITLNNPNLKFNGIYIPNLDTLLASYQVVHDFDIIYYYRRPGKVPLNIFRRKRAVVEIRFDNLRSRSDSLFTVVLERRKGFLKRVLK